MIVLAEFTSRSVTFLLLGVLVMIALSVALVVFFVVYQRRIYAQEQLRQAAEREHQRNMLAAAVEVQEAERRRIASDLHDGIGSLLSATRLYLRQLKPDTLPDKAVAIRGASLDILDEIITNTRRITHDLLPPVLEKFGFAAAAEDLCEKIDGVGGIEVDYKLDAQRLPGDREIALYRIVQELINNTLKHAEAGRITLRGSFPEEQHYELRYTDDGKGFDLTKNAAAGLGLRNIESRVTVLNGELNWTTRPGHGLELKISLPI